MNGIMRPIARHRTGSSAVSGGRQALKSGSEVDNSACAGRCPDRPQVRARAASHRRDRRYVRSTRVTNLTTPAQKTQMIPQTTCKFLACSGQDFRMRPESEAWPQGCGLDPATNIVAEKVIEFAQRGIRDVVMLRAMTKITPLK